MEGTTPASHAAAISSARSQYDALSDEAKSYVTSYDTLTAAEAALAQLQTDAANQAQAAADAAAAQAASAEAQPVVDAINAIGTVTLDSESTITSVRNQYNALSDAAKAYVTNYSVLTDAESTLQSLKEDSNS